MKAKTVYGIYSGIVEGAAVVFTWLAFDWRAGVAVLLLLWAMKVGHKVAELDRE